jgi:hypothetical protein
LKTILVCLFLLVLPPDVSASQDLVQRARDFLSPLVARVLGEDTARRWFGSSFTEEIELPAIPEIVRDARSTTRRAALNENTLQEEQWIRYNRRFVEEVFEASRRLRPNTNDIAQWMNVLMQGGTHEGVYRGMVLDQTYAGLENYPQNSSADLADFVVEYFEKYLNRTQTVERISEVNFFSIKRILVENSLEVFETLATNDPDSVYRWYAHLSGTLAYKYPEVFIEEPRSTTSMYHHYQWGQAVPEQVMKAELIVKLHQVMNFLQGSN